MNIIGKSYAPNDNSWCIDVSTGESSCIAQNRYNILNIDELDSRYIILTHPFKSVVKYPLIDKYHEETFINVLSTKTKKVYRVLFNEVNVD